MTARSFIARLAVLEGVAAAQTQIMSIVIRGGLPDADPFRFACAGDLRWNRREGEDISEFRARAESEALASGEKYVIFGGFPNHE